MNSFPYHSLSQHVSMPFFQTGQSTFARTFLQYSTVLQVYLNIHSSKASGISILTGKKKKNPEENLMKIESKSLLRKIELKCKVQKELKPQNTSSEGKLYLIPHLFRKAMDKDGNLPRTEGSGLCLSGQLEHRGQKKNVMKSLAEKKKKKRKEVDPPFSTYCLI